MQQITAALVRRTWRSSTSCSRPLRRLPATCSPSSSTCSVSSSARPSTNTTSSRDGGLPASPLSPSEGWSQEQMDAYLTAIAKLAPRVAAVGQLTDAEIAAAVGEEFATLDPLSPEEDTQGKRRRRRKHLHEMAVNRRRAQRNALEDALLRRRKARRLVRQRKRPRGCSLDVWHVMQPQPPCPACSSSENRTLETNGKQRQMRATTSESKCAFASNLFENCFPRSSSGNFPPKNKDVCATMVLSK